MGSHFADVAPRVGHRATKKSVSAERDHLQEELNRYKMEKEQSNKLPLEKRAVITAVYTYIVEMEIKAATTKAKTVPLANSNVELVFSELWIKAKSSRTGKSFIEIFSEMYSGFAFRVKKPIVPY